MDLLRSIPNLWLAQVLEDPKGHGKARWVALDEVGYSGSMRLPGLQVGCISSAFATYSHPLPTPDMPPDDPKP